MDYKLILFGAAVAVGITTPAQAETEFKVSASIAAFNGEGATLPAATIRGTAFFTENFGVEGEGSFGIGQDEIEGIDIELDSAFARLPAGEQLSLHASLGYGTSRFSGSVDEVGSADVDVDGFSGGIGAEYNFTAKHGIRANDTRFESDEEGFEGGPDVFSIGSVSSSSIRETSMNKAPDCESGAFSLAFDLLA